MFTKDSYGDEEVKREMQVKTLYRYFIHTMHMKKYFEIEIEKGDYIVKHHEDPIKNLIETGISLKVMPVGAFMNYWYGTLYIVCEGWQELKLHDDLIDNLLGSQKLDLLRRFRNGTFHYQKDYLNSKHQELFKDQDSVDYVCALTKEFDRWFSIRSKGSDHPR